MILKASWPETNQFVCIKCCRGVDTSLKNEIEVLKQLNAANVPNVPQLLASGYLHQNSERYYCFVTDLVSITSLQTGDFSVITNSTVFLSNFVQFGESVSSLLPLPLTEVQHMASDVFQALENMHKLGFVHSDVKPANIVRIWDESLQRYRYILIDFGLSFLEGSIKDDNWGCSIEYASIEMLNGNVPVSLGV